jgi:hypothetical protein
MSAEDPTPPPAQPAAPPVAPPQNIPQYTAGPPGAQQSPGFLDVMVPDKNGDALLAYYLGLFSIFPVAGLIMGPIAFTKGRSGLRKYKATPAIEGRTHAKVGIGCGWCGFLFNVLFVGLILMAIFASATKSH